MGEPALEEHRQRDQRRSGGVCTHQAGRAHLPPGQRLVLDARVAFARGQRVGESHPVDRDSAVDERGGPGPRHDGEQHLGFGGHGVSFEVRHSSGETGITSAPFAGNGMRGTRPPYREHGMTLLLNNDEVAQVLTMGDTLAALEQSYVDLANGDGVCRPRIDIRIPTGEDDRVYQWGTMEGGSARSGYFAIRTKSDVIYEQEYGGTRTQEKYCVRPGLFCGLVFLFRVRDGELLAIMNDGHLQHVRVGADSGIGVKYAAAPEASRIGMLGSGGMARTHLESITLARDIRSLKVYSPTPANREAYAAEMAERYGIEAVAVDDPREVYRDVDILCGCTDAAG
ncbi:MAG: hypothetical protein GEU81_08435, partial [Nitriliruptorales bacterium]|nr:hypothetical protein [Nitriliruptorales bacterium]